MEKKNCYGILDKVFPFGEDGLRQVPPECFECPDRLTCLKSALNTKDGYDMRSSNLERIPTEGVVGRLRRWSQKKELSRLADEKRKK